jgi:hypothetical protein
VSVGAQAVNAELTHGVPSQHGCVVEHAWPYCEHDGGTPCGLGLVHVPLTEPWGSRQVRPVQQSAFVAQRAPCDAHADPQCREPVASGTHGRPLQQSLAKEQLPPAETHVPTRLQRGTPRASGRQQVFVAMQAQQSSRTLVELPPQTGAGFIWQTSPAGSHVLPQLRPAGQLVLLGWLHVPIFVGYVGSGTHTTRPAPGRPLLGSPPQQSLLTRHVSPCMWQPDAGWQMLVGLLPYGPQV